MNPIEKLIDVLRRITTRSHRNLKTIRFEDELLPNWAQLLDLASRICPAPEETRHWFAAFTNAHGVDDARTILGHCQLLRAELQAHRELLMTVLCRTPEDTQAAQIFAAWIYSLDTMIQEASSRPTCSWQVEGLAQSTDDDLGGGEITLRRV